MKWTSLFTRTEDISAAAARQYLEDNPQKSFQLVDVRQPKEYQEQHIPGAILIPLKELKERINDLRHDLPTIVYCRSGVRSKAGCQILRDNNFTEVLNLSGGILQWNGATAFGGEDFGIDFFIQGTYADGFEIAYHLEHGLQQFYLVLAENAESKHTETLLKKLAQMEEGHMSLLIAQSKNAGLQMNTSTQVTGVIEGGLSLIQLQTAFGDNLKTEESVIQLAMMFEAQAWDLYSRLSRQSAKSAEQTFYLKMASEEQKHLDKLSIELDNLL
ncbi:MAG: rhodanese-related sulfurtransferase/rubrerythrin [Desulforhopalus sp.]|jgi:rhodanese-related sulfurtransferase/rubrerythrin